MPEWTKKSTHIGVNRLFGAKGGVRTRTDAAPARTGR